MQHFASLPYFTAAVRSLDRLNDADINAMSLEYSTYRALIINFAEDENDLTTHEDKLAAIMGFWKTNWHDITTIAKLARYCMTFTPTVVRSGGACILCFETIVFVKSNENHATRLCRNCCHDALQQVVQLKN